MKENIYLIFLDTNYITYAKNIILKDLENSLYGV